MRFSVLSALLLGAFAVGCSSATSSGASPGGGTPDAGQGTTAAEALNCVGILECASKCGDNNAPCEDACVAKGTPDAKTGVAGIVACIDQFKCADEACFEQNCSKELGVCVRPAPGRPLSGEAPCTFGDSLI